MNKNMTHHPVSGSFPEQYCDWNTNANAESPVPQPNKVTYMEKPEVMITFEPFMIDDAAYMN